MGRLQFSPLIKYKYMNKTQYFKRELRSDLFAAMVAISQKEWTFIPAKEFRNDKESVIKLMQEHRFDVIPVKDAKGRFSLYVTTRIEGDFSLENIEQRKINHEKDSIYYLTHIKFQCEMLKIPLVYSNISLLQYLQA